MWSKQELLTLPDFWLPLWYTLTVLKLRHHCNIALRNSCQAKARRCLSVLKSSYYTMLFLVLLAYYFCFAIAYIFRSFVLSHQIEFAVVLNISLAIFNTMHTLYVIRFMCRLYVIRSMHIVYVIRFICKLCHPVYVQNMWHPVCSQIIRKLVFIQSVCCLVYWFIRRITFWLCHESSSIAYIQWLQIRIDYIIYIEVVL